MSGFFNLGSLLLGVISWVIPVLAVLLYRKGRPVRRFSIYSFTLCAGALLFQLFEIRNRVNLQDMSAIMDTVDAICLAAVVLVAVAVAINMLAVGLCKNDYK